MTFERDFLAWHIHTVTVQQLSSLSTDGFGVRTYATGQSVKARIEQTVKMVKDQAGKERVSTSTVFLPPYSTAGTSDATSIGVEDKITLPSGFTPQVPPIINVERHDDDTGLHHWTVYL